MLTAWSEGGDVMLHRFEDRSQALISPRRFLQRMLGFLGIALAIDVMVVTLGALGFHHFESLTWTGAVLNATLIITGNGPLVPMHSEAGRLFETGYALFGGITFIAVVSVVLAPMFHRVLHAFQLGVSDQPPPA